MAAIVLTEALAAQPRSTIARDPGRTGGDGTMTVTTATEHWLERDDRAGARAAQLRHVSRLLRPARFALPAWALAQALVRLSRG